LGKVPHGFARLAAGHVRARDDIVGRRRGSRRRRRYEITGDAVRRRWRLWRRRIVGRQRRSRIARRAGRWQCGRRAVVRRIARKHRRYRGQICRQ
jgi:hypothetical protein